MSNISIGWNFQGFASFEESILLNIAKYSKLSAWLSVILDVSFRFLSSACLHYVVWCKFATNTIPWFSIRIHRWLSNFYVWNMWNKCGKKVVRLTKNVHQFRLISKVSMFAAIFVHILCGFWHFLWLFDGKSNHVLSPVGPILPQPNSPIPLSE